MSASGSLTREVDGAGDVEGSGTWMETEELAVSTISPRRRSLTSFGGALLDGRLSWLSILGVRMLAGTTSTKVFRRKLLFEASLKFPEQFPEHF